MALIGLMAAKKLRKKGYRPLAMLSPAADKMKSMKGGGMNRANMNKQMGYMGGGKVMKYGKGGMAFKSKCDGKATQGRTKGRMIT